MSKFHLVLLIHSHQPVGNFDSVFEKIYENCYLPFVECLQRHPTVRMGLHYSGPLLEWLERHHPEFFDHLRAMAQRGQIELLGGGFFEPILISIPPEDQAEQLLYMRDYLAQRFGAAPTGIWLTERIWEPQLPYALSSGRVRYTLVDDSHFLAAGFEPEQLFADFVAEERGRTVRLFPGLKALRYLLPFQPVEEAMAFLRASAASHPGGMAAMGDDCEKFGAWPGTNDLCYRDGWLDRFFSALEDSGDWLETMTPGEYVAAFKPRGRADLPTASYAEMMDWVLPTASRNQFEAISEEFSGRPDVMRFLRGGQWRGFFSKYSEANLLHKKMLHVSNRLRGPFPSGLSRENQARLALARTHLMRAQCNDAYWHGIFGGVYAPHLRTELWRELVRAETIAAEISDSKSKTFHVEQLDFNADEIPELYVTSPRMAALVEPAEGGTISALDFRPSGVTLVNSMQRRVETYHAKLREVSHGGSVRVASIHDQVRVKEEGLDRLLRYDRWPRHLFRLLVFSAQKTFDDYQQIKLDEHAELAGGAYSVRKAEPQQVGLFCEAPLVASGEPSKLLRCAKDFSFAHTREGYQITCALELDAAGVSPRRVQVGLEMVLNLLAPDEPDRYFEAPAGRQRLRWAGVVTPAKSKPAHLRVVDEWQDVAATIDAPRAAHLWISPIETVSESEDGFERVYQGSQILAVWPVELSAGSPWRGEATLNVELARGASKA